MKNAVHSLHTYYYNITYVVLLISEFVNTIELEEPKHNEDRYELLVTNLKAEGFGGNFYFNSDIWFL